MALRFAHSNNCPLSPTCCLLDARWLPTKIRVQSPAPARTPTHLRALGGLSADVEVVVDDFGRQAGQHAVHGAPIKGFEELRNGTAGRERPRGGRPGGKSSRAR